MQKHSTLQSATTVAPEPTRKIGRYYIIALVSVLALLIGSFFLPEPLRDQVAWNQTSPFLQYLNFRFFFFPILAIVLPIVYAYPFFNLSPAWPVEGKWRSLERMRTQAVENRLSGRETVTLPAPEVAGPLPATMSISLCRNWRATRIAGAIYALLIGLTLAGFTSEWQTNVQYLAQHGELSAWALPGDVFMSLCFCLFIAPVIATFLLTPRQRLIATRDSLICYRGLSFSYLPWQEALLFAVIAQQNGMRIYELSSASTIIRWSSKPTWSYGSGLPSSTIGVAPLGLVRAANNSEEYQWQIFHLTAMVAASTGLPLYDLHP